MLLEGGHHEQKAKDIWENSGGGLGTATKKKVKIRKVQIRGTKKDVKKSERGENHSPR